MARVEQIMAGIGGYIENEFIRSLPAKSPAKVIIGAAATLYLHTNQGKLSQMLESEGAKAFGIVGAEGNYDMGIIKSAVMPFVSDDGIDVDFEAYVPNIRVLPIIGGMINSGEIPAKITLYKQDIEKLFQYIGN